MGFAGSVVYRLYGMTSVGAAALTQQPAAAATAGSDSTLLAAARKLIAEGKAREAVVALQSADTTPVARAQLLGVAYYHADDYPRAIAQLAAVRDQLPPGSARAARDDPGSRPLLLLDRSFPAAIPLLEETRAWARDNLELGYVLGQAYIQTRQPDGARAAWPAPSLCHPIPRPRISWPRS